MTDINSWSVSAQLAHFKSQTEELRKSVDEASEKLATARDVIKQQDEIIKEQTTELEALNKEAEGYHARWEEDQRTIGQLNEMVEAQQQRINSLLLKKDQEIEQLTKFYTGKDIHT